MVQQTAPALAGPRIAIAVALAVTAAIAALATVGWTRHGEAILLKLADGAWATCF